MLVCYFAGILLLCGIDQLTKFLALQWIPCTSVTDQQIIPNVLQFTHVHNQGGAWGIFSGHPYLLGIFSVAIVAAVAVYMIVKRPQSKLLVLSLTCIVGGALGNIIDRFRLAYVIDFIEIQFLPFSFPVFNVADCFVTVGAVLFAVYVLFFSDKEEKKDGADKSNSRE